MKVNVGAKDRFYRIMIGGGIFAAGIFTNSWIGILGLLPWGTGMTGWCPIYQKLGKSTIVKKNNEKEENKQVEENKEEN